MKKVEQTVSLNSVIHSESNPEFGAGGLPWPLPSRSCPVLGPVEGYSSPSHFSLCVVLAVPGPHSSFCASV